MSVDVFSNRYLNFTQFTPTEHGKILKFNSRGRVKTFLYAPCRCRLEQLFEKNVFHNSYSSIVNREIASLVGETVQNTNNPTQRNILRKKFAFLRLITYCQTPNELLNYWVQNKYVLGKFKIDFIWGEVVYVKYVPGRHATKQKLVSIYVVLFAFILQTKQVKRCSIYLWSGMQPILNSWVGNTNETP